MYKRISTVWTEDQIENVANEPEGLDDCWTTGSESDPEGKGEIRPDRSRWSDWTTKRS